MGSRLAPFMSSADLGGDRRVVSWLTEKLVCLGHDVTLFASGDSVTNAELVKCCKRALRIQPGLCGSAGAPRLDDRGTFSRAEDFDIIHFHTDYLQISLHPAQKAARMSQTTWET